VDGEWGAAWRADRSVHGDGHHLSSGPAAVDAARA
jgi:hypothetical protein